MGNELAIRTLLLMHPKKKKWLAFAVANHLSDRFRTSQGTDRNRTTATP